MKEHLSDMIFLVFKHNYFQYDSNYLRQPISQVDDVKIELISTPERNIFLFIEVLLFLRFISKLIYN